MPSEELLLEREEVRFDEGALAERFRGSSALVVGAGGSLGARLVELLIRLGADRVVCVDAHEPSLFRLGLRLREQEAAARAVLRLGDVRDTVRLARLIADYDVDAVFNMAAYKHVPLSEENCDQVVAVNVLATLNLADAAAAGGVRDFVYPSTDKAVRPPSIYGATKRIVELELLRRVDEDRRRRIGVARLVNVFATAGNVIEIFLRQLEAGRPLTIMDPRMTRYCMTSREAIGLLATCAIVGRVDAPMMLELGEPIPMTRLGQRLAELATGKPAELSIVGTRPGERFHEELTYPDERLEPGEMPGVLRVVAQAPRRDVESAVGELRRLVADGDERGARRLLLEAAQATVPVG